MREMLAKTIRFLTPLLLTSAVAGGVLAILAPLGTNSFSLAGRFIYWIGLCIAGGLGAGAVEYGLSRFGVRPSRWPLAIAQSFGSTVAVSLFLFQIHTVPNLQSALMTLFYVWVVAMTICSIGALQKERGSHVDNDLKAAAPPALLARLKPALRSSTVYALEAQDHYVRVITSGGEDLLLMRLSDAISEAAPLPGLSPHRSWWVAEAGVAAAARRDGKAVITIKNDILVPVSRNRLGQLRAAGWL